jgi:hypothetical protein
LHELSAHAAEVRKLWSNKSKPERERMIVRAFLRCVGVRFSEDEISSCMDDPPDVLFRDTRFEVMEDLEGRKRGDEWREREQRWAKAERIADLMEPYNASAPMPVTEAFPRSVEALASKAAKYGPGGCAQLDALVYLNLSGQHLWPLERPSDREAAQKAAAQGWR